MMGLEGAVRKHNCGGGRVRVSVRVRVRVRFRVRVRVPQATQLPTHFRS